MPKTSYRGGFHRRKHNTDSQKRIDRCLRCELPDCMDCFSNKVPYEQLLEMERQQSQITGGYSKHDNTDTLRKVQGAV